MPIQHGGDWAGFLAEAGKMPLDFSANISPLGIPNGVRAAIAASLDTADRYPDPLCRALRKAIGAHHGVSPDWVLCGSGAADLIYRLALAARPRRALVTAPTFGEYEAALRLTGCAVQKLRLRPAEGFAVTSAIFDVLTPGLDLAILCEPNNPTGVATDPTLLRRVLAKCRENGTLLLVDECFVDFLPCPAAHTLAGELEKNDHLILLHAFTKQYALAGVRLGYALCSDPALLTRMRECGPPWAVSTLAQAAGVAALGETAYTERLHSLIAEQRPRLREGLAALGCQSVTGEANYLLFYHEDHALARKLRQKGVLLRDCSNYDGLGAGWYRAAVRGETENAAFLRAMKEALRNG